MENGAHQPETVLRCITIFFINHGNNGIQPIDAGFVSKCAGSFAVSTLVPGTAAVRRRRRR